MERVISVVLSIAMLMLAVPASAQTPEVGIDIATLPGVQRAVSRTYAFDVAALTELLATPSAILRAPRGPLLIVAVAAEFDTPEHAADAARAIGTTSLGGLADEHPALQPDATPVSDLGDGGVRFGGAGADETLAGYVVRDATWVMIAIVSSTDDSADATARDIVTYALGHPAGPEGGELHADGTSQGGPWSKLPTAADEDVLAGATPLLDAVLVPAPGENTPAT
ncbi:MAG TPA: hypothetical protein VM450_13535 [Thermomicrobiales bacterium]|nr:hypothetical protein [Thermomicrobiales bacterium]